MNITVRVHGQAAQAQIKALQAQMRMMEQSSGRAGKAADGLGSGRQRKNLGAWGSQLQWAGRQLQYNFAAPLILAGAAATKWALDNERAMTRVVKVYGDQAAATEYFTNNAAALNKVMRENAGVTDAAGATAKVFANEQKALGVAFKNLSSEYGVQQKAVIETAGAWAAAGESGLALAQSVELSLKAAVLGEMELGKATESLIAIQAQYSLSSAGMAKALAQLNAIENQTGISMQGLIDGFGRAAGVAREAGIDVRHLGAMLAALVPATGSAATAGNALKTIISRIMAPTKEAASVMREFGVDTRDAAWQSSTAMERLRVLAKKMNNDLPKTAKEAKALGKEFVGVGKAGYGLSDSQRQVVASVLGSRYQMNRFLVLMRDVNSENGYFAKGLSATTKKSDVFAQMQYELNKVLASSPKRLEILWYTLQNGIADIIGPLIPHLLMVVGAITNMVTWFSKLDPSAQKFFFIMAAGLVVMSIALRYFGAAATLLFYLGRGFMFATAGVLMFIPKLLFAAVAGNAARFSLMGLAATMIAMPFKAVAWAIGMIITQMIRIPIVAASVAAAGKAFMLLGAGAAAGMKMLWAATSIGNIFKLVVLVGFAVSAMVGTWTAGLIAMIVRWNATWVAIGAGSALRGLVVIVSSIFLVIFGIVADALAAMAFKIMVFDNFIVTLYYTMRAKIIAIWGVMHLALLQIMTSFRIIAGGVWSGLYIVMVQTATWASGLILKIQAMMYRALLAIQAAWGALATRLMGVIQVAQAAVVTTGSNIIVAVYGAMWRAIYALQAFWGRMQIVLLQTLVLTYLAVENGFKAASIALHKGLAAARLALEKAFWIKMIQLNLMASKLMMKIAKGTAAVMLGPWGVAIVAIIALVVYFRKEIVQIWNNILDYFGDSSNAVVTGIIKAWNMLPNGVANALTAVVNIVRQAALQVYEWFSYLNPFAHHSPSLVENVTKGMAAVRGQFATLSSVGKHIKGAYQDIKAFGKASAGLVKTQAQLEASKNRAIVAKFAPGALDEYDRLSFRLKQLAKDLATIQPRMDKQQQVVDKLESAVAKANNQLSNQQYILDQLNARQQKYQDLVDEATERLDHFSSVGITGQRAMSDAIFENEMAQKRLRLEMMQMEKVTGPLDDVRAKIEAINGAQEVLRGTQSDLRARGAGSEILSGYQAEIDMLEQQKRAYKDASAPLQNMQDQLDALAQKGEELDLLNSLQFDPLTRQIEQAANAMEELPFDTIIAGVTKAQSDIALYQGSLDAASAAVEKQQKVVDALTLARDAMQHTLDNEQYALEQIKKQYDEVAGAIDGIKSAMDLATQAAGAMESAVKKGKGAGAGAVSPGVQNFRDAAGGNFASVAEGDGLPMRKNWGDESKQIMKDFANETGDMFASLNPFNWIKKKWGPFKDWWSGVWDEMKAIGNDASGGIFKGVNTDGLSNIKEKFLGFFGSLKGVWDSIWGFMVTIWNTIMKLWRLFGPSIKGILKNAWAGIVSIFEQIKPELAGIWKEIKELGPGLKGFFNLIKVIATPIILQMTLIGKVVFSVIEHTIKPALEMIGGVIKAFLRILKGVFQFISGFFAIFSGDFEGAWEKMSSGIGNIVGGLFDGIWAIIKGAAKLLIGAVWGIVKGIFDWFHWLWDELIGHSIIPDIINGIWTWFKKIGALVAWVWDTFVKPVFAAFKWLFGLVIGALKLWWAGMQVAFSALKVAAFWLWDNVLKPIFDAFVSLWNVWIKPALDLWWSGVQLAWAVLKTAAVWLWDNVLKPVYDAIVSLWDNWVKPSLDLWWSGIKATWAVLKTAAVWLWDNVLKPVFDKVKALWENHVKPQLASWWEKIKTAWAALKAAGTWVWDNVLNPVFTKVKDLWVKVKTSLGDWWSGIKGAWEKLKDLGTWVWDHVLSPVFDKFKALFTKIKTWLVDNKDMLTKPIKSLVGVVRDAVNLIIKGLNQVGNLLPGISFKIDLIPEFAQGGPIPNRRVGSGFKTTGARAIVGEGKANHPEYVIPTDPTHRARATSLLLQAASKIGVFAGGDQGDVSALSKSPVDFYNGVPMYGIGGVLGDAWGAVDKVKDSVSDKIKDLGKNAIGKIVNPLLDDGLKTVRKMNWDPLEIPPTYAIDKVRAWTKDSDRDLGKYVEKAKSNGKYGDALKWARTQEGKPYTWGSAGPDGYDCSGFMSAIANHINGKPVNTRLGTTATFPWGGFTTGSDPKKFTIGSSKNYFGGIGHMAGTLNGVNVESAGGVGVRIGAAARGWSNSGFMNHAYLKEGGIALANRGPLSATIGDGRYDEAVVPLPKGWRSIGPNSGDGETHIHVHGDLSFPNIKTGEDADKLIENLKNLSKD